MHAKYDIIQFLVLLNVLNVYFVRGVLYSPLLTFISSFNFKQGFEISLKELDNLLSVLQEQKKKLEQEEAETSIQILLNVLYCLRSQKIRDLQEVPPVLIYFRHFTHTFFFNWPFFTFSMVNNRYSIISGSSILYISLSSHCAR